MWAENNLGTCTLKQMLQGASEKLIIKIKEMEMFGNNFAP